MDYLQLQSRSNADVGDGIEQLHGLEAAVRRQLLRFVVEYDRRRAWEQDGAGSMANWLCFRFGMTPAGAEVIVSVAHALEDLPVIGAAYESGLLSWDKLCLAVQIATKTPTQRSPPTRRNTRSRASGGSCGRKERSPPPRPRFIT